MKVRHLTQWLAMLCALLAMPAQGETPDHPSAQDHDQRPNILLMVVEDLSPRIAAFGDSLARTPNLDRLASEGIRYTHVFTTAGVCAPSRSALITGMHQHTIGTMHMRTGSFNRIQPFGFNYQAVPPAHVKAFPEYLRAAGYYTLNNAKTDYQFGKPSSIWDLDGTNVRLADRDRAKPFFFMLSEGATHEGGLFMRGFAPREPGDPLFDWRKDVLARNVERTAAANAQLAHRTDPARVGLPPYLPDTWPIRQEIAQHYDNIQRMDAWVGERLAELEASGAADNTIVIWTTDHGDGITRAKRTLFDTGLHVPMIIRWPDRRGAGSANDSLISFVDLAPSILSLAGVAVPDHMQGYALLDGNKGSIREYIYAARDRLDEFPDRSRAIRDGRYKLIRNFDIGRPLLQPLDFRENLASMQELRRFLTAGELEPRYAQYFQTPRPRIELYDTETDPHEITNLAGLPAMAAIQARLSGELDAFLERHGDYAVVPEFTMVNMMWPEGIQPITAAPVLQSRRTHGDRTVVSLDSATQGASIEYRLATNANSSRTRWELYIGALDIPAGMVIEARAIRYGYKPSADVMITPDQDGQKKLNR